MSDQQSGREHTSTGRGLTKGAMLLGAAGLLLFIVGVKRRHRLDAERAVDLDRPAAGGEASRPRGGP
jgi:hypothetical protein